MIYYIFCRLRYICAGIFLSAVLCGFVAYFLVPSAIDLYTLMIPFVGFAIGKPSWYLLMPLSRKQLLAWNLLEGILVTSFLLMVILLLRSLLPVIEIFEDLRYLVAYQVSFMLIGRGLLPLMIWQKTQGWQEYSRNLNISNFAVPGAVAILVYNFGHQLWFWATLIAVAVSFFPFFSLSALSMPQDSLRRVRSWSVATSVFLLVIIFGIAAAYLKQGASGRWINVAAQFMGEIPFPLPPERLRAIALMPEVPDSPFLLRAVEDSTFVISAEEWKEKTNLCITDDCLTMSSVLLAKFDSAQQLTLLGDIMVKCKPVQFDAVNIRCSGPRLSQDQLDHWMKKLVESRTVDVWLKNGDPVLQFVAVRALTFEGTSKERVAVIESLKSSPSRIVSVAASLFVEVFSPEQILREARCKRGPRNEPSCQQQSVGKLF
ncbi:hypothetical protein ACES2J_05780 [Bdellovibrio bacteriovorus]|uniref:hypothetical protein n=1 Tax=Bdellovibrio bacteriovorus TaxID=959 RepID=UPI0035A6E94B